MPEPDHRGFRPPEPPEPKLRKPQEEKDRRPLPKEVAEAQIESAEVVTRKELRARLERFQEIDRQLTERLHDKLDRIDDRPLGPQGSPEANNTSAARLETAPRVPPPSDDPIQDLYDLLARYEDRIHQLHLAEQAAARALRDGLSFPDTLAALHPSATRMSTFDDLVSELATEEGRPGELLPPEGRRSTRDINRYRELLDRTSRQSGLAESRILGLISEAGRQPPPVARSAGGDNPGQGDGLAVDGASLRRALYNLHQPKFESEEMVAAQALPGRRFSRDTERRGWLYVNTWYMIGPWDSHGRNDFSIVNPPELGVDLDAVYHDGQLGTGIAETDSHPLRVQGEEVELDGTLRWKFMQSESMHNVMPVTTDRSTCYAYTELYFEEPATMLVAIGTDDSGKLWINGREIWHDEGASWYHIDEHLEAFAFRRGWNRILVRIDNNGGAASGFSFLVCPPDAPVRNGTTARQ